MTQPEQKRVLQEFREGKFNVLVATCIAEEGLDIPEVQLIVCYDGAASPLRDVQRMGRTGRHSEGHVVYLLAEGKERRKYDRNNNESGYIKNLLRKALYHFQLNENNPRMIPAGTNPEMTMVKMETTHPKVQRSEICLWSETRLPSRKFKGRNEWGLSQARVTLSRLDWTVLCLRVQSRRERPLLGKRHRT